MSRKTILKARTKKSGATAEHIRDDRTDVVKIGELRVLVINDGSWWLAQGLEIDYAAQGKSLDEAKERFVRGLAATAHAYLEKCGSIRNLLRPAPAETLRDLAAASTKNLLKITSESLHEQSVDEPAVQALPFDRINFFERSASSEVAL